MLVEGCWRSGGLGYHEVLFDINLHELTVLRGVLAHLRHPESLHGVQLVGEVGQVHGRVELALQQGVEAVLGTQRPVLLRRENNISLLINHPCPDYLY